MPELFSVYWWDATNGQHEELRFVPVEQAMRAVQRLTKGPASMFGMVKRVIITDAGDCTNFEWKHGEGVVYPTKEMLAQAKPE